MSINDNHWHSTMTAGTAGDPWYTLSASDFGGSTIYPYVPGTTTVSAGTDPGIFLAPEPDEDPDDYSILDRAIIDAIIRGYESQA